MKVKHLPQKLSVKIKNYCLLSQAWIFIIAGASFLLIAAYSFGVNNNNLLVPIYAIVGIVILILGILMNRAVRK